MDIVCSTDCCYVMQTGIMLTSLFENNREADIRVHVLHNGNTSFDITIHEGRNRQIRRMLEAVGHQTLVLKRTREGAVSIGFMQPGEYRALSDAELNALRQTELS